MREVVIASAARTPIGSFQGSLSKLSTPKLGAIAIKAAVERAGIDPASVDEVLMGCVLQGGLGQAPARQASIFAGLPNTVGATTVHKVCGSGLKTVILASQIIRAGDADIIVAGGMENMSQTPYFLPGARDGMRLGHGQIKDMMIHDGLWDVYNDYHMGSAAELCSRDKDVSREDQDAFAAESYRRANQSIADGLFKDEIVPVAVPQRKGDPILVDADEEPGRGDPSKFGKLRPAFEKTGTVTAANASSINDGASAMVIMSREKADELGIKPLARIVASGHHAQAPEWFTTAPAKAMANAVAKAGLTLDDIDYFELNEAFSVVALAVTRELGLDPAKVNARGGAVALGHPIGASGNRILTTLAYTLRDTGARYGCAGICLGGGEAIALVIERL
ncbi:MAG: acetyl-CoA C-acetyltransferase [Deltaproteobacteria bacterium]|nr:MAG: acetyl-CoA C-acetyltransferase [Deltaproteobacteria bacterium]